MKGVLRRDKGGAENDYALAKGQSVWVTVNKRVVRIADSPHGVMVEIYPERSAEKDAGGSMLLTPDDRVEVW